MVVGVKDLYIAETAGHYSFDVVVGIPVATLGIVPASVSRSGIVDVAERDLEPDRVVILARW